MDEFPIESICFQICTPPRVVVIIAEESLGNVQQGLCDSPDGSAREVLTLLWRNGVIENSAQKVIFD